MNTCDTCKWWDRTASIYCEEPIHRTCLSTKIQEGNAGEDDMGYDYREGGNMHTGPKFGCIHHEAK